MSNNNHINFQIIHKNKSDKTLKENNSSILLVRRAINAICGIFPDSHLLANTTFAIRYLKDKDEVSSPVKTYFSVSRLQNDFSSEEIESIQSNVETTLGNVFKIFLCQLDWQQSLCTNVVSQIIKDEFFDLSNNLYAPKFLKASNTADFHQVINFMESKDSKTALEVCLKPYHAPDEKLRWMQAIEQMIQIIQSDSSSKSNFGHALADYQAYQKYYSRNTTLPSLFIYSVKAYGEKQSHVQALLSAFRDTAISQDHVEDCLVKSLTPQTNALVKVSHAAAIERPEWQNVSLSPIKKTVETPKKGWEIFVTKPSSLDIDNLFATGIGLQQITSANPQMQALPEGANQPTSQGQIVPSQGGQITQHQAQTPITISDLKPLHKIVCLEEIQGFLNLGVSLKTSYPTMTAEQIFDEYRDLITCDTYIVGLDDDGQPVTSSWDDIPHRLVAGQPGYGKTNFIQWLVFQFFYRNPKAKVYAMDFKEVDFPDLKSWLPKFNLEVITQVEDALDMIDMIDLEEENRKNLIRENRGARSLTDLQSMGVPIHRMLWIIDEAADIADASYDLSENIEKRLKKYARKGRSFGINMIYATQSPDSSVISKQVTDQLAEKTVFKVTYSASMNVLEIGDAEHIDRKGRAILHRGINKWSYVNTPIMPNLTKQPFATTVWGKLSPNL